MKNTAAPPNRHGFKLAIICALRLEAESVRAVFDRCWEDEGRRYGKATGDKNTYTTGAIGQHNVVLVHLFSMGGIPAAQAAVSLSSSFPRIELVLVVGVCGVVPVHPETKEEIVLGDVIVSTAVTQYDFGRLYPVGFERKSSVQDSLRKAPKEIQGFVNKLEMRQNRQKLQEDIVQVLKSEEFQRKEPTSIYPGAAQDHLYESNYLHQHRLSGRCYMCHDGPDATCSRDCEQLGCEAEKRINRKRRPLVQPNSSTQTQQDDSTVVHFGRFGSGNVVMKSGIDRDKLASAETLTAFEMEVVGVWDEHPTIMIKGACDYADSHKNKKWQPYAAIVAAACLKVVLAAWVVADEPQIESQTSISISSRMASISMHHEGASSRKLGTIQPNNSSYHAGLRVKNNESLGTENFETDSGIPKADFSFSGPVGICLGQAPYIDPELFIGRELELKQMRDILMPGNPSRQTHRLALGGMGGIGKTQLVIAYTSRHHDVYTSAFWFNATTQATLEADFQGVSRQIFGLSKAEGLSSAQAVTCVHQWLSHPQNSQWLLIFDNYDDPGQFKLEKYYPPASCGAIIVTTRRPDRVTGKKLQVTPLATIRESLEILATRSEREDIMNNPHAAALAKRLAGLPLALATAGAYLQLSQLTFEEYLREYEARWNVDPYDPVELLEYQDRRLYTTWSLSYARLEIERPAAAKLLRLLAYFDNQSIWYELLCAGNSDILDWSQEVMANEVQFSSVMRTLTNYCFIEVQQSTRSWSMHNCIHDWTLAELNLNIDVRQYLYAFNCVGSSLDPNDVEKFNHVSYNKLANHAARLMHARFWQDDVGYEVVCNRTDLAYTIAVLLTKQLRLPEAEDMHIQTIAGCESVLGSEHLTTLQAINNLGILYYDQGKMAESEQLFKKALIGLENILGEEYVTTSAFNNLGDLYRTQGKMTEAEHIFAQALAGQEKYMGPDHMSTLHTVNLLSAFYYARGNLEEAENLAKRALAGRERTLGPEHSNTLTTLSNLAFLYSDQGRLVEAEQLGARALEGFENTLGQEHPMTLKEAGRFGTLCFSQGKMAEAEQMYTRALAGLEKVLGREHISTITVMSDLARLYSDQDNFVEAENLYKEALSGYEKALGPEHYWTITVINNIGTLYYNQGRLDEADQVFNRASAAREKTLSPEHRVSLYIDYNLALLYSAQGKFEEGEQLYAKALAGLTKVLGENHPMTQRVLNALEEIRASDPEESPEET